MKSLHLTRREHQVLVLIVEGLSTPEIAARLGISPDTVNQHRSQIHRKLNVNNVAGVVREAIVQKLVTIDGY